MSADGAGGAADAVPLAEVKRVLVTKLRHHGDVLLASPVVSALKAAAPHAEVDALVYRDTAPMLEGHPSLARLHTIDRAWKREGLLRQLSAERALARDLAARRYDLLVHLTEHPRGIALARRLKPRWAVTTERAPERGAANPRRAPAWHYIRRDICRLDASTKWGCNQQVALTVHAAAYHF